MSNRQERRARRRLSRSTGVNLEVDALVAQRQASLFLQVKQRQQILDDVEAQGRTLLALLQDEGDADPDLLHNIEVHLGNLEQQSLHNRYTLFLGGLEMLGCLHVESPDGGSESTAVEADSDGDEETPEAVSGEPSQLELFNEQDS